MSSIVKAFSDLVGSIIEVFTSIIHTLFSAVQSIFSMFGSLVNNILHAFGGIIEFLFANILVIVAILAVFFAFMMYNQRQGKPVGAKKTA